MNTTIQTDPDTLATSGALVETLQQPAVKQGGAASSGLLNALIRRVRRDTLRASTEVTDTADAVRVLAVTRAVSDAGVARMVSSLQTQLAAVAANGGSGRALADFYGNALTLSSSSSTTADVSPLFGQATLPARSRRNVLSVERPGRASAVPDQARVLYARQPSVTSTAGAQPPADYLFGEDLYSVFALDGLDSSAWVVEDPTPAGHVCWVEVQLPGDVSGAYRCNELEVVPSPPFGFDLIDVRADVVGRGWTPVDFSYLGGYQGASSSVIGLGPSRLCFAQTSVRRFRLGLWVTGAWGFQRIRVLNATYAASASLAVDFDTVTRQPLQTVQMLGKQPSQLSYLPIQASGGVVSATLSPLAASNETPIVSGIFATW